MVLNEAGHQTKKEIDFQGCGKDTPEGTEGAVFRLVIDGWCCAATLGRSGLGHTAALHHRSSTPYQIY